MVRCSAYERDLANSRSSLIAQPTRWRGKGWWSVGSQPAVDGAPSTDPVVGFGPAGGFIFQKSFVELFMSTSDKDRLTQRIDALGPNAQITYFAGNAKGDFASNLGEAKRIPSHGPFFRARKLYSQRLSKGKVSRLGEMKRLKFGRNGRCCSQ